MYISGNGLVVTIEGVHVGSTVSLCLVLTTIDKLLTDSLARGGLSIRSPWQIQSNLTLTHYGPIDRLLIGNMLLNVLFSRVSIPKKKKESKTSRKKPLIAFVH